MPMDRYLHCPNGHGLMHQLVWQDVYACGTCGWGVTGMELHANSHRNVHRLIADKVIGRPGTLVPAGNGATPKGTHGENL